MKEGGLHLQSVVVTGVPMRISSAMQNLWEILWDYLE